MRLLRCQARPRGRRTQSRALRRRSRRGPVLGRGAAPDRRVHRADSQQEEAGMKVTLFGVANLDTVNFCAPPEPTTDPAGRPVPPYVSTQPQPQVDPSDGLLKCHTFDACYRSSDGLLLVKLAHYEPVSVFMYTREEWDALAGLPTSAEVFA